MTLVHIIVAALAGGVLSTLAAAATLKLDSRWIPRLVSFAVGALLGAVFLELVPDALEQGTPRHVMVTMLGGLLAFFLLEKLVLWRHSHGHDAHSDEVDESEHDHALHGRGRRRPGALGADDPDRNGRPQFLRRHRHRGSVPRQHAAWRRDDPCHRRARGPAAGRRLCRASAFGHARAAGVRLQRDRRMRNPGRRTRCLFALAGMAQLLPTVLAIAAASLLYVAVADLIPSLHRRPEPIATAGQMLAIALGVGVIAVAHWLLEP